MSSYWTKRRKILSKVKGHLSAINSSEICTQPVFISDGNNSKAADTKENFQFLGNWHLEKLQESGIQNLPASSTVNICQPGFETNSDSEECTPVWDVFNTEPGLSNFSFESESSDEEVDLSIAEKLVTWVSKYNISHTSLNALLSIERVHHPALPKDARTLLKTATHYNTVSINGGSYYHFGIATWVRPITDNMSVSVQNIEEVSLQVNIDGLPLFKSSNMQLWPILGKLVQPVYSKPFVIGLYSGTRKPSCIFEYTEKMIEELRDLVQNGIVVSDMENNADVALRFSLSCIICDAPARAFVKQIKSHNGYYGCDKCTQRGQWMGKMTFPLTDSPTRTDIAFNDMIQNEHHLGPSPFSNLPLGMVTQFPIDYMHLVCLGVMKRLLWLLMKRPLASRIGASSVQRISDELALLKNYLPKEFNRKARSLTEVDRWKASEYRQFLLYTGPVVLKSHLSPAVYKHFMFVGIFCLSSKILCSTHIEYANEILHIFVQQFGELYGPDMLVYNVHGLVHLAKDVQKFGPLDDFSCIWVWKYLRETETSCKKTNSSP